MSIRIRVALAGGAVTLLLAVRPVPAAADESKAFFDAMVRNVGMVEVDCSPDLDSAPAGEARVCLGPYRTWKDFRRIWDEASADARRVPTVPLALTAWETTSKYHERRYRFASGTVRVLFDRKRESVVLISRPDAVAAPIPSVAPSVTVAGPAAAAAAGIDTRGDASPSSTRGDGESAPVVEVAPVLIPSSRVPPRYPRAARPLRLSANVVLIVIVGPDSTVEGVIVDSCSNPGKGFEDAAVEAVSQWKFRVGRRNGEPARGQTRVVLSFTP